MALSGGLSRTRLERMHDVLAGRIEQGVAPGIVTAVSRHGEVHVDAIGMQDIAGKVPMRHDTIFRTASMTKPIAAVAAMILVEECRLRLDEPVDRLLPELAGRKVLRRLDGPLDDTMPAHRPITLRDLLTMRMGFGMIIEPSGEWPIQRAVSEAGLDAGPNPPALARAADLPFEDFLAERIFVPLGMKDTGFAVPEAGRERLAACYQADPASGGAHALRRRIRRSAIRERRAVLHRRRLPGLRPDDAERWPIRFEAHSCASDGWSS
jgi:CubicO group peptidase (beta-lactamase class C family)